MNRRDFIKSGAMSASVTAALPFWLQSCQWGIGSRQFPITVHSDQQTGHLVRTASQWKKSKTISTETVIVGGGLAGLAAAYQTKGRDYLLFELSDRLGGSSAALTHQDMRMAQGAHYELAYPEHYGPEVIHMLEALKVIQYDRWKGLWSFTDQQHIIPPARRQTCFEAGKHRPEVIENHPIKSQFYELISAYEGQMPLPTRLIDEKHRHLNTISFLDFLSEKLSVSPDFIRQMDYHMLDDYGGTCAQVSALAGVHYFKCRPYATHVVDLFSPPSGNDYFAQKITNSLDKDRLKTSHLVSSIRKNGSGYELEVLDIPNQQSLRVQCDHLIYAGQKHALQYIFPEDYPRFDLDQAPWMIINFVTEQPEQTFGYWQNEYLGSNRQFLGFVDSSVQQGNPEARRVFTAYYCLAPENREYLSSAAKNKERICNETLDMMEDMLGKRLDVLSAHINVMGHAMPIPKPGYLFNEAISKAPSGIRYAGVDCGRLPLLFEALDSGLLAAQEPGS